MSWIEELSEQARAALPEDLVKNETLSRYKNVGELAKATLEQKALISQSLGRMPSEDAGPEARQEWLNNIINKAPELALKPVSGEGSQPEEFWRLAGKPEAPDQYTKADDIDLPPDLEAQLRDSMFKANATQEQFDAIAREQAEMYAEIQANNEEQKKKAMDDLRGKWGAASDQRMDAAKKVAEEYFQEIPFDQLPPSFLEGMYKINEALGKEPGTQAGSQPKNEQSVLTPAEAEARIQEIMNNPAYWNRSDPQNAHLIKKVMELRRLAGAGGTLEDLRANSF